MNEFKPNLKMKTGGSVDSEDIKQDKKTNLRKLRDGGSVFGGTDAKLGSELSKLADKSPYGGTNAKVGSNLSKLCGGGRAMKKSK